MKTKKEIILDDISENIRFIKNAIYYNYCIKNENNLEESELIIPKSKLLSKYEEYYNKVLNNELKLDIKNFETTFRYYNDHISLFSNENIFNIKVYVSEYIYADLKLMKLLGEF